MGLRGRIVRYRFGRWVLLRKLVRKHGSEGKDKGQE
jgi:hypothetical protein